MSFIYWLSGELVHELCLLAANCNEKIRFVLQSCILGLKEDQDSLKRKLVKECLLDG